MVNLNLIRSILAATSATLVMGISPGHAQEPGSFYFGGGVGLVVAGNTRADGVFRDTGSALDGQRIGPEPGRTASGKFDASPTTRLTLGYDLGKRRFGHFRFEGELFYQSADTGSYEGELDGTELDPVGRGETSSTGAAINVLYNIREIVGAKPYIHLGYGQAKVETKYDFPERGSATIDGSSQIIQGGFGAAIPFRQGTSIDLRYRFRRAGLNEAGLDTDVDAHILEVGIRYPL